MWNCECLPTVSVRANLGRKTSSPEVRKLGGPSRAAALKTTPRDSPQETCPKPAPTFMVSCLTMAIGNASQKRI